MLKLKSSLQKSLKGAARVAIVGIGSQLRADDAAGELVVRQVQKKLKKPSHPTAFFLTATAPENFTGEIKNFRPDCVIIIDCAELKKKPGTIEIISSRKIAGESFSTHRIPTNVMADYLKISLKCKVIIIGIQPKSIDFDKPISKEVQASVKKLAEILTQLL
jgi:hydrogenase 3 maturation protease